MNRKEIISTVSGLLTSEFVALDDIIEAGVELGFKPVTVNFCINTLVKENKAEKTKDKRVRAIEVEEFEIAPASPETPVSAPTPEAPVTPTPAPKTPKSSRNPFGVTKVTRPDGTTYRYIRSAFDGPEGKLDEEYEEMKDDFITFSGVLRDLEEGFEGAGPIAITLTMAPKFSEFKEAFKKFGNDEGKLFFRWDNGNKDKPTQKVMDILYPTIKAMADAYKEAQKVAQEGVQ